MEFHFVFPVQKYLQHHQRCRTQRVLIRFPEDRRETIEASSRPMRDKDITSEDRREGTMIFGLLRGSIALGIEVLSLSARTSLPELSKE